MSCSPHRGETALARDVLDRLIGLNGCMGSANQLTEGFPRVATLGEGDHELRASIEGWIDSAALAALVRCFGNGADAIPQGALAARLQWLDEFSLRWDYRSGKERNLASQNEFSPETAKLVLAATDALGLKGGIEPSFGHYDHILILGGLVRACIARPLHAALLLSGKLSAGAVTALGGYRVLGGDELPLAATLGLAGLNDEFEVMDAGVRRAFALQQAAQERGEDSRTVGASWRVREYRTADDVAVSVIAAPSSEPGVRRANTPDTYQWFAGEFAHIRPQQRILIVTTAIYVPFQHANALRMFTLPFQARVDTVGIQPGELDSRLQQTFLPHQYLQEVRSTIRALRDLHAALEAS